MAKANFSFAATEAAADPAPAPEQAAFLRDGVLGPVRLFTEAQCRIIAETLRRADRPGAAEWDKGCAVTDRFFYELATPPLLISLLRSVLGNDVILWGARTIERRPGQTHAWHSDIESCAPDGRFVSAWVGIENTSQESALHVISRSHLWGKTIQQVLTEKGLRRGEASAEEVLAWAREFDPSAELHRPAMGNGEMLLFDGRLWHGSHNSRGSGKRLALLLQYAAADMPVNIPDLKQLEWPFRYFDAPRPPVIVVSGTARDDVNRIVSAPQPNPEDLPLLFSAVHRLPLPLAEEPEQLWKPHRILRGRSTALDFFNCHVSILSAGHSPHPPHAHAEEEVLIVLDGEAELVISDGPAAQGARIETVRPGAFIYYPPFQHHTIRNVGTAPVTYLMLKWRGDASQAGATLGTGLFRYGDLSPDAGRRTAHIIRGATPYLSKLGCHLTVLPPNDGYPPHGDPHDVAILLLTGEVETLGETVTAPSLFFYAAGEPHGMRNVGAHAARYLVFEFRPPHAQAAQGPAAIGAQMHKAMGAQPVRESAAGAEPGPEPHAPPGRNLIKLGERLARRLKRALRRYRGEQTTVPPAVASLLRSARKSRAAGDLSGALAIYSAAAPEIREHPIVEAKREKIARQLRRQVIRSAHELHSAGDLKGALAIFGAARPEVREHPTVKAKRKKVTREFRRQRRKRALAITRQVRQLHGSGDIVAALAVCRAAPKTFRDDPRFMFVYGQLLEQSQRYDEAYEAFRAVLKLNPAHDEAWAAAGPLLLRLGRNDELPALIDEMLAALPPSSELSMRAFFLADSGNLHSLTGRLLDRALSTSPSPRPRSTIEAARILLRQGEQARVINLLDRDDLRTGDTLTRRALDLQGLALAQLRLAGRTGEIYPAREQERAGVVAAQSLPQETRERRVVYRPTAAASVTPGQRMPISGEEIRRRAERHASERPERWRALGFDAPDTLRRAPAQNSTGGKALPQVSIVLATHRVDMMENCRRNILSQDYPNLDVLIVLNHDDYDEAPLREFFRDAPRMSILRMAQDRNLGSCINFGASHATGAYITKMDDDDFYGPSYISDLVLSALESDADITGKKATVYHFEDGDDYHLRTPELRHKWLWPVTDDDGFCVAPRYFWRHAHVAGATMFIKRDVLLRFPFDEIAPRGTDTLFQSACRRAGLTIYASDEFNFCYRRRASTDGHLWKIEKDAIVEEAHLLTGFECSQICV